MKHGSLPQRILRAIGARRVIRREDLTRLDLGGYDQVGRALGRLEDEGYLEKIDRATWLRLNRRMPRLMHARTWSRPSGVSDDATLRATLSRPSFDDLAALCLTLGLKRVDDTLADLVRRNEIGPRTAARDEEILSNVKAGLLRKDRAHEPVAHR